MLTVLMSLFACGGGPEIDVSGTVGGEGFTAGAAWWGGPYVVFTEGELDCLDMSWVRGFYDDENPPGTDKKRFLQFSYQGEEVATGIYDVTGDAAVTVDLWEFTGDSLGSDRGRTGSLIIDEITNKDELDGSFNLDFDDGSLKGTFEGLEWCTNIKS